MWKDGQNKNGTYQTENKHRERHVLNKKKSLNKTDRVNTDTSIFMCKRQSKYERNGF